MISGKIIVLFMKAGFIICNHFFTICHGIARNKIGNYIKYNKYDYEKTKEYKNKNFISDRFVYNQNKYQYECPAGRVLDFAYIKKTKTALHFYLFMEPG